MNKDILDQINWKRCYMELTFDELVLFLEAAFSTDDDYNPYINEDEIMKFKEHIKELLINEEENESPENG